jgi:hypothetical protein
VLVCYLDDSGKDPQNPITTLAGYIARDTAWEAFEGDVEPWFRQFNVGILHAKQLHDTDDDFKGWSVVKKQTFVSRICQARNPHIMMGLSMSAEKGTYTLHTAQSNRKRTATPYSFCFNVINDWVFRDIRLGSATNTEGVAYILEWGHENNAEVENEFYAIKQQHPDISDLMRSISFAEKASCRAIQLADLYAFYSRRSDAAALKAKKERRDSYQIETMTRIITENLPHHGFVATAFDQFAEGSRFLAGDP